MNRHDSPGGSTPGALADATHTSPLYALFGTGLVALSGGSAAASTESIDEAGLHRHIAVLASDEFEGRWPGTHGEQRTLDYLQREFKSAGAKPGNGDSFLQPVPLVQWTLDPEPTLVVRNAEFETELE